MPRILRPGLPNLPRMPPPPQMQQNTPNVLSAAPQLINRKDKDGNNTTTIEAKPQIRNLAADVTRFLPTSLRVKRVDRRKPSSTVRLPERIPETHFVIQPKTKDDAYMQFMHEMEGLL